MDFTDGLNEDTKAQLLRLRDLTRRTGVIYEPQALQLRMWPRVLFPCDAAEVVPDIEDKALVFSLKLTSKPPIGKGLKKRTDTLETWVRTLLGDDWKLSIKASQKKAGAPKFIHRGDRKKSLPDKGSVQADLKDYEFKTPLTEFKRYNLKDMAEASVAASAPLPSITLDVEKKS